MSADKARLRTTLLTARRQRSAAELATARASIAGHVLAQVAARGWQRVAAYEPMRTEPGSAELLLALAELGVDVFVPLTRPDRDLDWLRWPHAAGAGELGMAAIAAADLVLVPALAVAADGTRLGRGGGSYDRALLRVPSRTVVAALLFDGELADALPSEPWDVPIGAAVTPSGWLDLLGRNTARHPSG